MPHVLGKREADGRHPKDTTKMNDFTSYLVESYSTREIEPIITALKTSMEFNNAVCSSHRSRKWKWGKGSKVDDAYAYGRTLLSIDKDKRYSLRQVASLINIPSTYIKNHLDYSLFMESHNEGSRDHRRMKYSLGSKGLTKEECFIEVSANHCLDNMDKTSKLLARDILARCRSTYMSVSKFLSSSIEEIMEEISDVPMDYSSLLLGQVARRMSVDIAFSKARLALCACRDGMYEWFKARRLSNSMERTIALCDKMAELYSSKLREAMKRPMATLRDINGKGLEFSGDMFYYTHKNGSTSLVSYEELRNYVFEECLVFMSELYRKELYNIGR